MKKRFITGIGAVVLGIFLNSTAFAYPIQYLDQGESLDFESGYSAGDPEVLLEPDGVDGNALKLLHNGQLLVHFGTAESPFANAAYDGQYLLSFDACMSHVNDSVKLLTFVQTNSKAKPESFSEQKQLLQFGGGVIANGEKGGVIGTASYPEKTWQHYDLLLSLYAEEENTLELYIDGALAGVMNLTKSDIYGIGRIIFLFGNYTGGAVSDAYALVDNIRMGKFTGKASGALSCTREDSFRITFSETMPQMQAEDFFITRSDTEGGEAKSVPFTLGKTTRTSAELILENMESGIYTVEYLGTTAFGKSIPKMTYTRNPSEKINLSWDFEDGQPVTGEKNAHTPVYEENRGMVLDFNGADYIPFRLEHALTKGKYILSYDAKYDKDKKDFILRTLNADGIWGYYQVLSGQDGIRKNDNNGTQAYIAGVQHVFEPERWYRIDNVMNLDTQMAEVYLDGEYIGESELWDSIRSNPVNTPMKGFTGIYPWWQNGAGQLDNIRIKNVEKTYRATLHADQAKLYLDFDETTVGLTEENFRVTSAENILSEKTEEPFRLIYQNGTRAVLELTNGIQESLSYQVELLGVRSFLGHTLEEASLTASKSGFTAILAEAADGKRYSLENAPSDTVKLVLFAADSLKNRGADGEIRISDGEEEISGAAVYDEENHILTLTLDRMLGANRSYEITVSGFSHESGAAISDISGSIRTGAEIFRLSAPELTLHEDSAEVLVQWVNTKEDRELSLILVGYQEGILKMAEIQPITSRKDDPELQKKLVFSGDLRNCDSFSAFLWEDYTHIRPLTGSVTK